MLKQVSTNAMSSKNIEFEVCKMFITNSMVERNNAQVAVLHRIPNCKKK